MGLRTYRKDDSSMVPTRSLSQLYCFIVIAVRGPVLPMELCSHPATWPKGRGPGDSPAEWHRTERHCPRSAYEDRPKPLSCKRLLHLCRLRKCAVQQITPPWPLHQVTVPWILGIDGIDPNPKSLLEFGTFEAVHRSPLVSDRLRWHASTSICSFPSRSCSSL